MSPTLWRAGLRHGPRHPVQLLLAVLGIALGVAVVVAVDLTTASARRAFVAANALLAGDATHHLVAGPGGIPEQVYPDLRRAFPDLAMTPVVDGRVHLAAAPGRRFTLVGVDPFATAGRRAARSDQGGPRGVVDAARGAVAAALLVRPGAVALEPSLAADLGVAVGGTLAASAGGGARQLVVAAFLEPRDPLERVGLAGTLVADIATAQEVLGRLGRLDRIDVVAPAAEVVTRLAAALPEGLRLVDAPERSAASARMTAAFELNLRMLGVLALVVGLFLIFNTVGFSVVQRRALLGTLRALGVTRREVLALVLGESVLLAAAGAALGVALGVGLARALLAMVARTVDDLYVAVPATELAIDASALAGAFVVGVLAGVAAAAIPALEAARVAPTAALARSDLETRVRAGVGPAARCGLVVLALGALLAALPARSLGLGFAALFAVVAGFALMAPWAAAVLLGGAERLALQGRRVLVALSVRGARASLSRTAVAVAALAVALAATVGVATMVGSFRASVERWLDTTLRADLYVGVGPQAAGRRMDRALVARIARLDGVREVSSALRLTVESGVGPVRVSALDPATESPAGFDLLETVGGSPWAALAVEDAVLVSEPFAWRHRLGVGDRLELLTRRGMRPMRVLGIYRDYETERGVVLLHRAVADRLWAEPGVTGIGVYVAPGASTARVLAAVADAAADLAGDGPAPVVTPSAAIRAASLVVFDRTFAVTEVLRSIAALVAVGGIVGALMAIQLDRAREIAVLRAQGLTRGEVFASVQGQSAALGLTAGTLAVPLGIALAAILVHVVNRRSFGWSMDLRLDLGELALVPAVAVGAALVAGLWPAWRMARTNPALALRGD